MSLARCLHPPGGAAALTAVIGGSAVHAAGFGFALLPVAANSALLVALALVFHRVSGHAYPHRPAPAPQIAREQRAAGFEPEDIDAAHADMHESSDIAREDLDLSSPAPRSTRGDGGPGWSGRSRDTFRHPGDRRPPSRSRTSPLP